jgi:hypothetical protein
MSEEQKLNMATTGRYSSQSRDKEREEMLNKVSQIKILEDEIVQAAKPSLTGTQQEGRALES